MDSGTQMPQVTYGGVHAPPLPGKELPAPEPTFGPGDSHVNKASRKVNQGFEVLPAGTFETGHELAENNGTALLSLRAMGQKTSAP